MKPKTYRESNKMKFVADSMLGKLAKWLRVLGYDTHYQSFYPPGVIVQFLENGRYLLTRHEGAEDLYRDVVLLRADRVGKQLDELKNKIKLTPERTSWFTRCLVCNAVLEKAHMNRARDSLPEYVFYSNMSGIRLCPSCGRYYWPGSHKTRMIMQLEEWGFI